MPVHQNSSIDLPRHICRFLEKGICWYGAWGIDGGRCPNFHPEPCVKFLDYGEVLPHGCNKGVSCKNYHLPFFCEKSTKYLWCNIKYCKYFHHVRCIEFRPPSSPIPRQHHHPITHSPSYTPVTFTPTPSTSSTTTLPPPTSPFSSSPTPHPPLVPPSPSPPTPSSPITHDITPICNQINNHQPILRPEDQTPNFPRVIPNYYPPPPHQHQTPSPPHHQTPSIPHHQTSSLPHHQTPSLPHHQTPSLPLLRQETTMMTPSQVEPMVEEFLMKMKPVRNN